MRKLELVPLIAVALGGCTDLLGETVLHGDGRYVEEYRNVGAFTGVSNATAAQVEILQGADERLRIRGEENLLPHVRTRVENGVLRIYTDANRTLRPTQPIVVELDVFALTRILLSGSGDINAPLLDARVLEVTSSGSGDIYLDRLLADELIITSSGSGEIRSTGDAYRVRITHSGSGHIDTRELRAREVDATLSGSGDATVRARDRLYAVIAGAGSLRFYGSPSVQSTVSGSGRVQRLGN